MKSDRLYPTYKDMKLRDKLIKKYGIQESQLAGHYTSQLYPTRVNSSKKQIIDSK